MTESFPSAWLDDKVVDDDDPAMTVNVSNNMHDDKTQKWSEKRRADVRFLFAAQKSASKGRKKLWKQV